MHSVLSLSACIFRLRYFIYGFPLKVHIAYLRYLVVCHSTAMIGREKKVGSHILMMSVCTSLAIGLASFVNREDVHMFLTCMGKEEWFIYDLKTPFVPYVGGENIKFNPFRFSMYVVGYTFIAVVPILYHNIFKFRQIQDTSIKGKAGEMYANQFRLFCTISGISEKDRNKRKQKNLVSTRLNFIAWILQVSYNLDNEPKGMCRYV